MNIPELSFTKDKRVAVVGSSGILLNTEFGSEIDDHDIVVRFNVARTEGYEKHVGSKTDIRVMNGHSWAGTTNKNIFTGFDNKFTSKLRNTTLLIKSVTKSDETLGYQNTHPSNKVVILSESIISECSREIESDHGPTCGALAVILLSKLTDNINCYGFNFYHDDWCDRHYWENINKYDLGEFHNIDKEYTYLSKLNETGSISLR
jgi:hypothetical protein